MYDEEIKAVRRLGDYRHFIFTDSPRPRVSWSNAAESRIVLCSESVFKSTMGLRRFALTRRSSLIRDLDLFLRTPTKNRDARRIGPGQIYFSSVD